MQNHKSNLEMNTEKLVKQGILTSENIAFYADVFNYQFTMANSWAEKLPQLKNDPQETGRQLRAGSIILEQAATEILISGLSDMCSIIHKHNPGMDMTLALENIRNSMDKISLIISSLLDRDMAKLETLASDARIGFDEYIFLVLNWLKPLFIALREAHHHPDPETHSGKECPFCGYYPDMALFSGEKEGKRYLRCGLCENLWLFPRIACAICGESGQKKLEYFTEEGNERYRVDVCHTCNGYIKSVRLNKLDESESCDLSVENLLTLSFDSEMLSKGYIKP